MLSGCCILSGVGMEETRAKNQIASDNLHEAINTVFKRINDYDNSEDIE